MAQKHLTPEDINYLNRECIERLKKKIKDDSKRHSLIGLSIEKGYQRARAELPEIFFMGGRAMTSKAYEAAYMADEQERVLALLEKDPNNLETLTKESSQYESLGERVERRLLKLDNTKYKEFRRTRYNRMLYQLLIGEHDIIRDSRQH